MDRMKDLDYGGEFKRWYSYGFRRAYEQLSPKTSEKRILALVDKEWDEIEEATEEIRQERAKEAAEKLSALSNMFSPALPSLGEATHLVRKQKAYIARKKRAKGKAKK